MFLTMGLVFAASLFVVVWLRVGKKEPLAYPGRADAALFAMALAAVIAGVGESNASKQAVDVAMAFFLVGLVGMAYLVSGEVRGPKGTDKESQ